MLHKMSNADLHVLHTHCPDFEIDSQPVSLATQLRLYVPGQARCRMAVMQQRLKRVCLHAVIAYFADRTYLDLLIRRHW